MNTEITIYFFDGPEVKQETVSLSQLPALSAIRSYWRPCLAAFQAAVDAFKGHESSQGEHADALRGDLMRERARLTLENPFPMPLREFYSVLQSHDWFYYFSDDHRVWVAGEVASKRVQQLAKISPDHQALYDGFSAYHFSGESFGKPKAPYPEKPV